MQDQQLLLDGHKLLWHLDRLVHWQTGKRIAPLHLDLGISTGCNMSCIYCYGVIQGRKHASKRFNMPKDAFLALLKDAKAVGVRSVALIGEGENTLNDALYDGLLYAKQIDLDMGLASNGILLTKRKVEAILPALVWLRYNISAATEEGYLKIHGVNTLERVTRNIKAAVDIKRNQNLPVTIGTQMVVVKENIKEIIPLAKLCRELGVDYLVIKPCSDTATGTLDAPHQEYAGLKEILTEAEMQSTPHYKAIVKWDKINNCGQKGFDTCYGTPFLLQISGDGTVFPCGHFFNIRRDEFAMGNVIRQSFEDIVNSDRYWQVQSKMQSINVHNECETNCRHYYINQFLWGIQNPPQHINFI